MTRAPRKPKASEPGSDSTPNSRQEILKAAAETFCRFGYSATTIDAVAEHLGATKGRIYHHYRSKAELYLDVQIEAMERLLAVVTPIAQGSETAAVRLRSMAMRHTEGLLQESSFQKISMHGLESNLLTAESARHIRTIREIVRMRDEYEQLFAEVIDAGIRAGDFVDIPSRLATKPFLGALNWVTVWYSVRKTQKPADVDAIAEFLVDFCMRGIMKEK